jgi:acetylornithine deacetylase/succinyl-diaminopimelate desuccinylase-like protein
MKRIFMPSPLEISLAYARANQAAFLADLSALLRIPSISTAPEHQPDIRAAADEVAHHLTQAGLRNVQVLPTQGHPVVYADSLCGSAGAPTVLIYGHYDVQPVDPLELWHSAPFEPSLRGDYLHARGASDMKGQVEASISAVRAVIQAGGCPVNVKFLVEGEEEIGSPHLRAFLEAHRDLLRCDFALNPDAGMIAADIPTIVYALRGLAFFELKITGPSHDLHSGTFGGVVHNPAVALCELIAGMHDTNGTITLPGFYSAVRPVSPAEHAELQKLPMGDDYFLAQTGAARVWGEKEFLPVERVGARPTLEVNGMISGYTGAGTKTVLPAQASAKISCRLVADQKPEAIHQAMRAYVQSHVPATVRWELAFLGGGPACATDPHSPYAQALARALETAWGKPTLYKREGGSVPVVADMQEVLGADSVLTGFGLPDDRIHSPNEHLHLPTWYRGIEALIRFFYILGEVKA